MCEISSSLFRLSILLFFCFLRRRHPSETDNRNGLPEMDLPEMDYELHSRRELHPCSISCYILTSLNIVGFVCFNVRVCDLNTRTRREDVENILDRASNTSCVYFRILHMKTKSENNTGHVGSEFSVLSPSFHMELVV